MSCTDSSTHHRHVHPAVVFLSKGPFYVDTAHADAIAVSKHLQRTTGSTITIQATDYLCNNCYKSHLAIITELQRERVEAEKTLENCITRLRVQEEHADTLTYKSVVQSALFVAEHLVQDKAVLLPHVCRHFLTCCGVKSQNLTLTIEENDCTVKFSSRWLLGQLIIHLNPHMQYICVHKRLLQVFFQYSHFVCGDGSICNANPKESFPAFLRLVGSCYFKNT